MLQDACTPFASHALQTLPFHSHLISHALHLAHAAPFTLEVVEAKAGTCSEWRTKAQQAIVPISNEEVTHGYQIHWPGYHKAHWLLQLPLLPPVVSWAV